MSLEYDADILRDFMIDTDETAESLLLLIGMGTWRCAEIASDLGDTKVEERSLYIGAKVSEFMRAFYGKKVQILEKINLEIALAQRGIHTTKDFSDAVGISRQTLAPIRAGVKQATQEVAEQIAKSLNFTDEEFYDVFPTQYTIRLVRDGSYISGRPNSAL